MKECKFCKMARGEVPVMRIYEDDSILCFLNENPINPGHALVIPKRHFVTLFELPAEELHACIMVVQKVAWAVCRGVEASGLNVVQNNHEAAGQSVKHVHFHLIPRYEKDGFVTSWSGESKGELSEIARKIQAEL